MSRYGHCAGDTWIRCDGGRVVTLGCGSGQCRTVDAQGTGACTCGGIGEEGVCAAPDGSSSSTPKTHFTCATILGVLVADNCTEATGNPAGFCSTLVTSFGSSTGCFCAQCSAPGANNQCAPLCSRPSDCRYYAAGNFHTCGF
ncbi:hypothetical protein HUA74_44015 [Myxococcus sp. CA051A]|uniref:hypothetical protein n=1 Tax=Myxococcus sp. CA051A TaxID=2741739 RepID=UPI00157A32C7|nr:hypothetical protein [Myxococcus sp. CA051A]NTX67636.1 hypothetical protein [Myxococcus sp. CA051A]